MAQQDEVHRGRCFCGSVEVTAKGRPFAMGYCHCDDCRAWSAGPVNAFTLWPRDAVAITRGRETLGHYRKTEFSDRQFCTHCGGHVLTDHPPGNFTDVYAALLPSLEFSPQTHVHYGLSVLQIDDDLPKHKDLPAEMGGSGELIKD